MSMPIFPGHRGPLARIGRPPKQPRGGYKLAPNRGPGDGCAMAVGVLVTVAIFSAAIVGAIVFLGSLAAH